MRYELREIYSIKTKRFSLFFGTWHRNFGLEISNVALYLRRSNFQKIEITVVHGVQKIQYDLPKLRQAKWLIDGYADVMNFT